ncbi:hypothetical protein [Sunxiuqinia dokdonensis]|uniref:Uncharacterized protein n=1 Tax=Sunxiuqinia dokdonensis TaxID=1409788 RepID=A0A0L8VFC5_9BACT|nr:hypothetical protein [Sunxiuqinia dokdonensis]KOH46892.1 hypothetical protein NC99_02920 [Sunxiuqinia dokdonensis]
MDGEELYWFFKNFEDDMKAMKAVDEAFHAKLSQALFDLVFAYWPEWEEYREQMADRLRELAERYSNKTMEGLNFVDYHLRRDEPVKNINPIPKPLSAANAEAKVQEFFAEFPDVPIEEWRSVVWEDFEDEMRADHFVHRIHKLMKEIVVEFYLDPILKFEPEHLLLLDDYLYMMGAYCFSDAVYELEYDAEQEKNPSNPADEA